MHTRRGLLSGIWAAVTAVSAKAFMPGVKPRSITYRFTEVRRGEVKPGEYYFLAISPEHLKELEATQAPWRWWASKTSLKTAQVVAYRREIIR